MILVMYVATASPPHPILLTSTQLSRLINGTDVQIKRRLGLLAKNDNFITLVVKVLYIWGKVDLLGSFAPVGPELPSHSR